MTHILHLSDLHFFDRDDTAQAQRAGTLDRLVKELAKGPKLDVLVISGERGWEGNCSRRRG